MADFPFLGISRDRAYPTPASAMREPFIGDIVETSQPTFKAVSFADMERHAYIEDDFLRELVEFYIDAAVAHIEQTTGHLLGERTVMQSHRRFPWGRRPFMLMRVPLSAGLDPAIKYTDINGVEQTMAAADVEVYRGAQLQTGATVGLAMNADWPDDAADQFPGIVRIEYTAGYPDKASIFTPLRQAILMLAAHWYENRAAYAQDGRSPTDVPTAFEALIDNYRLHRGP